MVTGKRYTQYEGLSERAVEILLLLAEGLSDREIAERLVMTINTVKWYNRQIYSILGVGSRTQAIARARELQLLNEESETKPALQIVRRPPQHNLPVEVTRFIGRKREMEVIKRLLDTAHLLTLVGPPGTGKTRLALQIAWEVVDTFREGAYFVSLAPISDPALVMNAIATTIGVNAAHGQPLIETLKHVLRERQMLLILDNFEHLLPAAPQVSELLSAAPHLKVLATSREPLHLYGEQEYAVPPLELPDTEHLDPQALVDCESTALFMQKARAVRSDFELTAENALDVANICVRLEGLPLAIELAAARTKLLTPRTLLSRLSSRLDTLTGGAQDLPARHQTLQNTIDWSYNLLDDGEKILFARLAVFRGERSLEAIEAICSEALPMDVFDGLESLINKSLIQQKEQFGGESRFIMLETLHEYALERLEESGESKAMHRRHAEYFVQLAERAEPELRQAQQLHWFQILETEHENMRTVLQWSLADGDITLGVRLVGALVLFWFAYGYHVEARQWIQQLLDQLDRIPTTYHPKLLFAAGHITMLYDLETARGYFSRGLHLSRELGDKVNIAWLLIFLGYTMMSEIEAAFTTVEQGLSLFQELNHKPGIAQTLNIIGELARFSGDDDRAKRAYEECLVVSQETGETRRIRFMLGNLSFLAQHEGDYERAQELAEQSLVLAIELNNRLDIADVLAGIAGIMGVTGEPERAARLLGTWEAVLEQMGAVTQPVNKPEHDRHIADVRAQLDPTIFDTAWLEGRAMSLDQAVASVLEHSGA
ncbi:MAG: AAA family ATPase [Burkholderiales bacterium]|nr:AAA family ATPase [Anaerolineae bacterium]